MKNTLLVLAALFLFTVSGFSQHYHCDGYCRQVTIYHQLKADLENARADLAHHRGIWSPRVRHYYVERDVMRIENLKQDLDNQRQILKEHGHRISRYQ